MWLSLSFSSPAAVCLSSGHVTPARGEGGARGEKVTDTGALAHCRVLKGGEGGHRNDELSKIIKLD